MPLANFMFSDTVGASDRIGVLLTSSYSESHKPRDSSNVAWERTTDTSRPAWFHQTSRGEDELERARTGLLSQLVMQGESSGARAAALARGVVLLQTSRHGVGRAYEQLLHIRKSRLGRRTDGREHADQGQEILLLLLARLLAPG